jgi:hypothetical protein
VEISDALELGQAFLLVFLQYLGFFCAETRNLTKNELFGENSVNFL